MIIEMMKRRENPAGLGRPKGVRVVKPLQFDDDTAQTSGVRRLAAISHTLVGSQSLWAGVLLAEPNSASSVHHHGPLETAMYVLSGAGKVRWGNRLEREIDLEPGDFVFVPPYVPHQEVNLSPDRPTQWVVVRGGRETIIVDLIRAPSGEYVEADESAPHVIDSGHPIGGENAE